MFFSYRKMPELISSAKEISASMMGAILSVFCTGIGAGLSKV